MSKSQIYDLIVIGGGSAGLVAAGGAATLGARVALIEKDRLGGDCLYTGCVPSKTLIRSARFAHDARHADAFGFEQIAPQFANDSFSSITERVKSVIRVIEKHDAPEVFEKMGVEVVFGSPRFVSRDQLEVAPAAEGETRTMRAKRFCIATGSSPLVPAIDGLRDAAFLTNENIFDLKKLPASLVILGGGPIGIELGQAFSRFGSRVTIVEMAERILDKEDAEVSDLIKKILEGEGAEVRVRAKAVAVGTSGSGKKVVTIESAGKTQEIECDELLVAVGRRPNVGGLGLDKAGVEFDEKRIATDDYLRTSQKHIFAAGDVTGHFQFTHMADREAQIVIRNAFVPWPFKEKTDLRVVPWAIFTDPEVGRVGIIEANARKEFGDRVKVYKLQFDQNDRAQAEGAIRGFAKVVTIDGKIAGATVVGKSAGELIHEFVWAVKQNLKVADLNRIIRVYPTLSKITQAVGTESTLEALSSPFARKWFARYLRIWR